MRTRIPYGYQIIGGKAVPHPVEAPQIKELFDLYVAGMSIKQSGALAEIRRTPTALKHILLNPIYGGSDPFYPALVDAEMSERAALRVTHRGAGHIGKNKKPLRQPVPVDTEFVFTRAALSHPTSVQALLQNVFDCIVPVRDASPETLDDYMSGLSASDLMSGAFDFAPDLTVLPLREDTTP
ncbi:MAG: hypothetical protein IKH30_00205 [Clostridia bacterium]|nr:hypothetical protein [Clostridia bacterium]